MQPKPIAETVGPWFPSVLSFISKFWWLVTGPSFDVNVHGAGAGGLKSGWQLTTGNWRAVVANIGFNNRLTSGFVTVSQSRPA